MSTSPLPPSPAPGHHLHDWIGAPVQLLGAGGAQHEPVMTRLTQVAPRAAITLQSATHDAAALALAVDEPVIALVYTGTEIAQFRSRVLRLAPAGAVELACPGEMRFHRLRREPRRPACIPATVAVGGREMAVTLIDFSEAGCHLTCPTPLGWPGTRVRILFGAGQRVADGDDAADALPGALEGEIRWVNQVATAEVPHFACGLRFDAPGVPGGLLDRIAARLAAATPAPGPIAAASAA